MVVSKFVGDVFVQKIIIDLINFEKFLKFQICVLCCLDLNCQVGSLRVEWILKNNF